MRHRVQLREATRNEATVGRIMNKNAPKSNCKQKIQWKQKTKNMQRPNLQTRPNQLYRACVNEAPVPACQILGPKRKVVGKVSSSDVCGCC